MDLSFLDQPEILEAIFPLFYSQYYTSDLFLQPKSDPDYLIQMDDGIQIGCEFWVADKSAPSILFFHGNGEAAANYEYIATFYNERGINLFVADYRGYGASNGTPTVSNMLADARTIFIAFKEILESQGFGKNIFVMGRSLGSMSSIEVAANFETEISGLIVESGSANNFRHLFERIGYDGSEMLFGEESSFLNKYKIRKISRPTLIIHGEDDELVPLEEGKELYQNSGARDKKLLIIPEAGHNDIMTVDQKLYFGTVELFVKTHIQT